MPYIPKNELEEIWGQGFVFLRQVDSVDNMGAYICKYLGKANFDKRYFGKKKFFYSSSLRKPLVFSDPLEVDNILKNYDLDFFGDCLKTFTFNTQYLGDIIYYQYRLGIDLSDEIGKKENNEKNTNS